MSKFITSFAIIVVSLMSWALSGAQAEDRQGFYFGAGVGANLPQNVRANEVGTANSGKYDLDPGFATNAAAGYAFGNGIRTELEVGYNDVDPSGDPGADVDTVSAMINAIYEFPTSGRLRPYIGAGIGVVRTDYDSAQPISGIIVDDADTKFGAQGIAGITFQASDTIDLFLDYRFMRTGKLDLVAETFENVKVTNKNHIVMAGLRYYMGAPQQREPAPQPVALKVVEPVVQALTPEPEPVTLIAEPVIKSYRVYFAWDRADLDREGRQIVFSAAASALQGGITRINVTGHADRSGSEAYNMILSEARALTVRDALISNGVAATSIVLRSRGESDPEVQTPDGQTERRNRRVEIIMP